MPENSNNSRRLHRRFSAANPEVLAKKKPGMQAYLDEGRYEHPPFVERELNDVEQHLHGVAQSWLRHYFESLGIDPSTIALDTPVYVANFETKKAQVPKEKLDRSVHLGNALEEGVTVILQHRFLTQELLGNSRSKRLQKAGANMRTIEYSIPREALSFIADIDASINVAPNEYVNSVRLVLFLMEHVPNFEELFQKARIEKQSDLWRAINAVFGNGAASLVGEASVSTAFDTIGVLAHRLSQRSGSADLSGFSEFLELRSQINTVASQTKSQKASSKNQEANQRKYHRVLNYRGVTHGHPNSGTQTIYVSSPNTLENTLFLREEEVNFAAVVFHEMHHATAPMHYRIHSEHDRMTVMSHGIQNNKNGAPQQERRARVKKELEDFREYMRILDSDRGRRDNNASYAAAI